MLNKLLAIIESCGGTWSMRSNAGLEVLRKQRILVSVDDFFGEIPPNEYYFSTNAMVGDKVFHILFKEIKEKRSVQNIWIEIHDYNPDEDEYPYAEVCYITTTAGKDEVYEWFGDKAFPSNISLCESTAEIGIAPLETGYSVFCCWWN